EKDLGDSGECARQPAEPQDGADEGDDGEKHCPTQHDECSFKSIGRVCRPRVRPEERPLGWGRSAKLAGAGGGYTGFRAISWRAMMMRCISLVPSPIISSGASR